jgi:hypothetical protein
METVIGTLTARADRAELYAEFGSGRTNSERDKYRGQAIAYRETIKYLKTLDSLCQNDQQRTDAPAGASGGE